jgi:hypothetical protein
LGECLDIGSLAGIQRQLHSPEASSYPRYQLGVDASFSASYGWVLLTSGGIASVLIHLDIAGIQKAQYAIRLIGKCL